MGDGGEGTWGDEVRMERFRGTGKRQILFRWQRGCNERNGDGMWPVWFGKRKDEEFEPVRVGLENRSEDRLYGL